MIFDNVVANFTQFECSECGWKGLPFEGNQKFVKEFQKKVKLNAKKKNKK